MGKKDLPDIWYSSSQSLQYTRMNLNISLRELSEYMRNTRVVNAPKFTYACQGHSSRAHMQNQYLRVSTNTW